MKSAGQLLSSLRQKQDISLEDLSRSTKIDIKYLVALEADRYQDLPSETFVKGFIRNVSKQLGANPEEIIAVFRRDYKEPAQKSLKKASRTPPSVRRLQTRQKLPLILGGLVFFIYLVFQFRAILTPPSLELISPSSGQVVISPVEIRGKTDLDALITIMDDGSQRPEPDGSFRYFLNLPIGEKSLTIKATNRFSRSTQKTINLTVVSP